MTQRAIDSAAQVRAKVTLPSEPRRPVNFYDKTDVTRTWERFRPEPDFVTGKMTPAVFNAAPEWWRKL